MPIFRLPVRMAALAALACLPLGALAQAPTVKFDLQDGAKISDTTTIVAHVVSPDDTGIDKVEFMVDDQPRGTDTSVPYTYDWDTLADTEGAHTLTATAFDAKGRSQRATLKLTIDNDLGKGAEFHADAALEALKAGNVDLAANAARRAAKIDPTNLKAARALAGIYKQRREYPAAIAVLEKATIPANDIDARNELAALYIAQASGESTSTEEFLQLAAKAGEAHQKVAEVIAAAAPAGDVMARGDARFGAHNWPGAIVDYQRCSEADNAPMACTNRLILAYIRGGRLKEAQQQINNLIRFRKADDVTRALHGMLLLREHKLQAARDAVQEGAENGVLPSLIIATYADIGLKQTKRARSEADRAAEMAPNLAEVQILQAYTLPDGVDADRAVLKALQLDPSLSEAYSIRGFQTMMGRDKKRFAASDQLFDFAMKRDPASTYAQLGMALSLMAQNRPNEAEPILAQLAQVDNGPDLHIVRAVNFSLADKTVKITPEMTAAQKLDPENWQDALPPTTVQVIPRVFRYRFSPTLTPESLYPKK